MQGSFAHGNAQCGKSVDRLTAVDDSASRLGGDIGSSGDKRLRSVRKAPAM